MDEELVARLFKKASNLGWKYGIDLLGDESIVPMAGPDGELDCRISDSEHVIHELAHCVLRGLDFTDADTLMDRLNRYQATREQQDLCVNEIETFAVTMEVLRRWSVPIIEDDFLCQLDMQLHDFEPPEEWNQIAPYTDTVVYMKWFGTTDRMQNAVQQIMDLLEGA